MSDVVGRGVIELTADARKMRAGFAEAKKSIADLGKGQRDVSASASRSIDRYIQSLQIQNRTLGKSVRETELFKLAVKGASDAQLSVANAALLYKERLEASSAAGMRIASGLTAVATIAGTAAVAFGALTGRSITFLAKLDDLSKSTNIAAEDLAGLDLVAKLSGTSLDSLATAINRMSVEIGKDPKAFRQLGVDATSNIEAFKQLADVFVSLSDVQQRNALAQKVFGKSWQELAPVLSEGGARLGE